MEAALLVDPPTPFSGVSTLDDLCCKLLEEDDSGASPRLVNHICGFLFFAFALKCPFPFKAAASSERLLSIPLSAKDGSGSVSLQPLSRCRFRAMSVNDHWQIGQSNSDCAVRRLYVSMS